MLGASGAAGGNRHGTATGHDPPHGWGWVPGGWGGPYPRVLHMGTYGRAQHGGVSVMETLSRPSLLHRNNRRDQLWPSPKPEPLRGSCHGK